MCYSYSCSQEVEMLVEDAVHEAIQAGRKFTAFDITVDVRAETDEKVYHSDIKGLVHNLMEVERNKGNYVQELHPVHAAFLYKPAQVVTDNPEGVPFHLSTQASTASVRPIMSPKVSKNTPTPASGALTPDARGSLSVRAKDLRSAGLAGPGNKVYAHVFTGHVVLTQANGLPSRAMTTYTVDSSDNIRITKATLNKAGLNKTQFDVKVFPHSLEIR